MIETMRSILRGMFPSVVPAGWWRDPAVRRIARAELSPRQAGTHPLHRGERGRVFASGRPKEALVTASRSQDERSSGAG
jgi:hypothetical protein